MSEADRSASTADSSTGPSLGELRARLLADETLPETRRRDMASAVASLAKAIGKPAEVIPAKPKILRAEMKGLTAAMVGMKTGRWKNVQSLVGAALFHYGIVVVQGRIREAPRPSGRRSSDCSRPTPGGTSTFGGSPATAPRPGWRRTRSATL